MAAETKWLIWTLAVGALFVLPYVLDRILGRGLFGAMANPSPADKPQSGWADRAQAAHQNFVENIVIFAPLVILIQVLDMSSPLTTQAAMVFFGARVAHYVIYVLGIPVLRTLAFLIGYAAMAVIALHLLGYA